MRTAIFVGCILIAAAINHVMVWQRTTGLLFLAVIFVFMDFVELYKKNSKL